MCGLFVSVSIPNLFVLTQFAQVRFPVRSIISKTNKESETGQLFTATVYLDHNLYTADY